MCRHITLNSVLLFFSFLLLPYVWGSQCLAASFSADMIETFSGQTKTSRVFVLDHLYRLELNENSRHLVILVDRQIGKTRMVLPDDKVFRELDNFHIKSVMNNAFEAYYYMVDKYKIRSSEHDNWQGLACNRQVISINGKDAITVWISNRYQFPVKIKNQLNGRTVTLSGIKNKTLEKSFFKVPADYRQVKRLPFPLPEWARNLSDTPLKKPPFEMTLAQGQIIRIRPADGYILHIEYNNFGSQHSVSSITPVAFRNGRPLSDPGMRTFNLSAGKASKRKYKEETSQADYIVVRVKKGQVQLKTTLKEKIAVQTYVIKANNGRGISIDPKKAVHIILKDDPADGKQSDGKVVISSETAKHLDDGSTTFEYKEVARKSFTLANGQSRTWKFSADKKTGKFGIRVLHGGVHVRIEQPEKSGQIPPSWKKAAQDSPVRDRKELNEAAAVPAGDKKTASQPENKMKSMVLILDASGSMWGQIKGKPKIQIAKEVMADLIDRLPSGMRVGLMAYGHRRKGDCKDIEMLLPVGKLNPPVLKAKIKAINPKGKTPLSAAVEQAAEHLRYTEEGATVVLVSDGLETCNANPCELAEKLAMNGFDFTVHVVGFDLSKEEQNQLRCLADKTGGIFLAAADAAALREALFMTVEKIEEPAPVIKEVPGKAKLDGPESVPAGSGFKVKWQGPGSLKDYVAIAKKGSKDSEYVGYAFTKAGNPVRLTAPGEPGNYELRYIHAHSEKVIGRTDIRVIPVSAQITVPASVEAGTEFEAKWQGPAYDADLITIARPEQGAASYLGVTYVYKGNPARLTAPPDPGTYEVRYILGHGARIVGKSGITVQAAGAVLQVPASISAASEFEVKWQGPGNNNDLITIARPEQDVTSYLGVAYAYSGNPVRLTAPSDSGTYEVRYILGNGAKQLARAVITVTAP